MKFRISGDGWETEFEGRKGPLGANWDVSSSEGQGSFKVERLDDSIFRMHLGDQAHVVTILPGFRPGGPMRILVDDIYHELNVANDGDLLQEFLGEAGGGDSSVEVLSVMPGIVRDVFVEPGQEVEEDQPLLILEAMKMENEIRSPIAGVVDDLPVSTGDTVAANDCLMTLEAKS